MKKLSTYLFVLKWETRVGKLSRNLVQFLGLKLLHTGRFLLKWSGGRCSYCGANCGFISTISRKGLRCDYRYPACCDRD